MTSSNLSFLTLSFPSLVPSPVRAIQVTRGGLEPSAIARGRPRRIFPTSLTGDVTSEIAEDDWERGSSFPFSLCASFAPWSLAVAVNNNDDNNILAGSLLHQKVLFSGALHILQLTSIN